MAFDIQELSAREEIRQCIMRHFRAADRVDIKLAEQAFWDDGHFVGGPVEGPIKEALPALYNELLPAHLDVTCHYISNFMLTVEGDKAYSEVYGQAYHLVSDKPDSLRAVLGDAKLKEMGRRPGQRYELIVGVRYAIVLEKRKNVWKILTMEPLIDWTRVQLSNGIQEGGLPGGIAGKGKRSEDDGTYFGKEWRP